MAALLLVSLVENMIRAFPEPRPTPFLKQLEADFSAANDFTGSDGLGQVGSVAVNHERVDTRVSDGTTFLNVVRSEKLVLT